MKLKSLDLHFEWPDSMPIGDLQFIILEKLRGHGDPLRWAITNVNTSDRLRHLTIEAVVVVK